MKNWGIISCALFILTMMSCAQYSGGKFEVNGQLKNSDAKMVYLKEVDFNNEMPVVLDSSKIKADGSFTLKGNVKGQHLFTISTDDNAPTLLINDHSEIKVNIDNNNRLNPKISGSEATQSLYTFMNEYRSKDSILEGTFVQLDSLNKAISTTPAQDSLKTVLNKLKAKQLDDMNGVIKTFAANSNNAVATFYVLYVMAPRSIEPKELLTMAENASAKFKDDGALAGFVSRLKQTVAADDPNNFALMNQQAPDLAMQTPDGKPMKISDFKGKYLLVDFWASWCGPCRAENPNVVAAYNKFKDKNFTILGVSLDKDKDAWVKAIQSDKLVWNQMSDLKQWDSQAVKAYQINGIPFNVLIDPTGKIIANNLRGDDLENKLAEVLK